MHQIIYTIRRFYQLAFVPIPCFLIQSATAQSTSITSQLDHIALQSKGKLGMFAQLLETGDTLGYNSRQPFPMQSVYKLPINMIALHAVDHHQFTLGQSIEIRASDIMPRGHSPIREQHPNGGISMSLKEILQYSVSESDGTACDVLLRLLGGTSKTNQALRRMGIKEMTIATFEREQQVADFQVQYRNWAYPRAAVQLLDTLYRGHYLAESTRALLLQQLEQSTPGPKRIKGLLPAGTVVAHKTGTSGTEPNGMTRATNDIGVITLPNGKHIAIAVFISDSTGDEATREAAIAQTARLAWDYFYQP